MAGMSLEDARYRVIAELIKAQAGGVTEIHRLVAMSESELALAAEKAGIARHLRQPLSFLHKAAHPNREWRDAFPVFVHVTGEASSEDDDEVPGAYEHSVGLGYPCVVADLDQETLEMVATAVLNCFHGYCGIDVLDDFKISVKLQDGSELFEGDGSVNAVDWISVEQRDKVG